jgi:GNAT superfamily N-acetyltransferase
VIEVRRATVDDVPELVRLRGVMLSAMSGREPAPGPWQDAAATTLARRLPEPAGSLAAFVVDRPDESRGLAACAVGVIECRLGDPNNPSGEIGHVFNVATDPGYRRRGYSRACLRALLDWYRQRGIVSIDLRATPDGEPLYRALGFAPTAGRAMRLLARV